MFFKIFRADIISPDFKEVRGIKIMKRVCLIDDKLRVGIVFDA